MLDNSVTSGLSLYYYETITEDVGSDFSDDIFPYGDGFSRYSEQSVFVDMDRGNVEEVDMHKTFSDRVYQAISTIEDLYERFDDDKIAVMWSGGIDSTIMLYLASKVASLNGYEQPSCIFMDHVVHVGEDDMIYEWSEKLGFDVVYAENEAITEYAVENNLERYDPVPYSVLGENERDIVENSLSNVWGHERGLENIGEDEFPLDVVHHVSNQVMKTYPRNRALFQGGYQCALKGHRWTDERVSVCSSLEHTISNTEKYGGSEDGNDVVVSHPVSHFIEVDIWRLFWRCIIPNLVSGYPENFIPEDKSQLPKGVSEDDIPLMENYWNGLIPEEERVYADEWVPYGKSGDKPTWYRSLDIEDNREIGLSKRDQGTVDYIRALPTDGMFRFD